MKKTIIFLMLLSLSIIKMDGARAYPHPKTVTQPDGTTLTLIGHGDEFRHYVTTADGYTVLKSGDGFYRYAVLENGFLKASSVIASDAERRSATEKDFLYHVDKGLKPSLSETSRNLMKFSGRKDSPLQKKYNRRVKKTTTVGTRSDEESYRGLVILVNFTDRKFSRGDEALKLTEEMMNKPGRRYYYDPLFKGSIECTGSVRDFFYDNSNGRFITGFDVVGPIDVDVNQYYINATDRTYELCRKVLENADSEVDFSRYDSDGDGEVDMVYILYAGYSSVYQGNDERLVWPHAGHFEDSEMSLTLDGMRIGRFACSSEIFGWHDDGDLYLYLDGIGVIVHEFSHILGFKDHYDVSGYLNEDPGAWDVMASGNYNGVLNDTPCGYNSYEKYAAGFLTPTTVTAKDNEKVQTLHPLSGSNDALRIKSMQDSTIFMIENRQLEKWDKYLPGHGMLVWRVDSCDNEYWQHNALNVNGRLHFKLIRANGATRTLFREIEDTDYDPFPGTRNVTDLTNYSLESNLLSDKNYPSPMTIREIKEDDRLISFRLEEDPFASFAPYTFALNDNYVANGLTEDGSALSWTLTTGIVETGGREKKMFYTLIPDPVGLTLTDPKYKKGLGVPYAISEDRRKVYIEPYRVALLEDYGLWIADFNNLEKGGSGAIMLDMSPYGDLSLSDPESVIGYCVMPKSSVVVDPEDIIERLSWVKDIKFQAVAGIGEGVSYSFKDEETRNSLIFNLQGIPVSNPKKGELYIVKGKKVVF